MVVLSVLLLNKLHHNLIPRQLLASPISKGSVLPLSHFRYAHQKSANGLKRSSTYKKR